jgi:hypothetical protein
MPGREPIRSSTSLVLRIRSLASSFFAAKLNQNLGREPANASGVSGVTRLMHAVGRYFESRWQGDCR